MSVDTYLKGKDLSPYRLLEQDGVTLHVAPSLAQWSNRATIAVKPGLLGKRFDVIADHRHQPT